LLASVCAISACTVGPDYAGAPQVAPDAAHASNFVRTPAVGMVATRAPSQWWLSLNDPQLNALIDAALAHNPDVHAAQARLREARSQLQHQKANGMPTASFDAAALRMREPNLSSLSSSQGSSGSSSSSGGGPLQLYTAGFDASWEIDLFGGTRRAVEAATAEADAVDADLADTQVSLAAEVAQAYVDLRDEQQRLTLAQRSTELEQQMLTLTQQRRAHGTAADVDVERLTTQVENTRATLTPLDEQVAESLDQLAVLTGQAPGALDQELSAPRPLPALPASVAIGDPASMLQQRPDIRAAERRLASSNAQIGEHKADFFPKVTLFGDIGYTRQSWPPRPQEQFQLDWCALSAVERAGLRPHALERSRRRSIARRGRCEIRAYGARGVAGRKYFVVAIWASARTSGYAAASAGVGGPLAYVGASALYSGYIKPDRPARYPTHAVQRAAECGLWTS